jgi:hypothetical protein
VRLFCVILPDFSKILLFFFPWLYVISFWGCIHGRFYLVKAPDTTRVRDSKGGNREGGEMEFYGREEGSHMAMTPTLVTFCGLFRYPFSKFDLSMGCGMEWSTER